MLRAPILSEPSRPFRSIMNPEDISSDDEISPIGASITRKSTQWSPFTQTVHAAEDPRAPTPPKLEADAADTESDGMPQDNQSFDEEIAALGLNPATVLAEAVPTKEAITTKAVPKAVPTPQAAAGCGKALSAWSKDKTIALKRELEASAKPTAKPLVTTIKPAPTPAKPLAIKPAAAKPLVAATPARELDKPEGQTYVADPKQPDHIVYKGCMLLKPSIVFADVRFIVNEARKFTTLQQKTSLAAFKAKAKKLLDKATADIANILASNKGPTSAPQESYASNQQLKIAEISADLKH